MNEAIFKYDNRLDTHFLETLYENDKEYAAIVFEQFLKNYPEQIADVENSFEAGNFELMRQKIHKLKPTFSFVGLTGLTAKSETLEKKCMEQAQLDYISELYADFKKDLNEYIPIVEEEFEKLKA
jgi:HPt (histidine-containing phosphotransfer) domain-containing protein